MLMGNTVSPSVNAQQKRNCWHELALSQAWWRTIPRDLRRNQTWSPESGLLTGSFKAIWGPDITLAKENACRDGLPVTCQVDKYMALASSTIGITPRSHPAPNTAVAALRNT
jgi:hypothetical protein